LCSRITIDVRVVREIKSRIPMAKVAIHKRKTVLINQLNLNLRKKLVKGHI
jgi:hypothetical protein